MDQPDLRLYIYATTVHLDGLGTPQFRVLQGRIQHARNRILVQLQLMTALRFFGLLVLAGLS